MSHFNVNVSNETVNIAGGRAFKMNAEQELAHAVLSSFLDNKFYESGSDRLARLVILCKQVSAEYLSALAYFTRKECHMRTTPVVLLGELAKNHKGNSLVWKSIERTIERVDDMTELGAYFEGKLPSQVKRGLRRAILKFNRYALSKYKGQGKAIKLVDLFNLVHPNPNFATDEQKQAWKDLLIGKLSSADETWEAVISASKDKQHDWEKLVFEDKLGYMAMLRNLNNLVKNDVSKETISLVAKRLVDPEKVRKSKQLPFRFATAYNIVENNVKLKDAISEACDIALDNIDMLPGKTLIALDCSGSMGSGVDSYFGKGSLFAAALFKKSEDVEFVMYDTQLYRASFSRRTPLLDVVNQLKANGGGTQTSLVFDYCVLEHKLFDRVIIISDNESWIDDTQGNKNTYMKMAPESHIFCIDIAGYGTKDVTGQNTHYITGWSDNVLQFIKFTEQGKSLVDTIKDYEIKNDNLSK